MGADADAVVEVQWSSRQWVPLATFHFYDRDYEVFGEINGVRRSKRTYGPPDAEGWRSKIADEEIAEPLVVEPRGFPPDLASYTADRAAEGHCHLPTWLTFEECLRVEAQIARIYGQPNDHGHTWPAILACMKSSRLPTRLVFWTDQA